MPRVSWSVASAYIAGTMVGPDGRWWRRIADMRRIFVLLTGDTSELKRLIEAVVDSGEAFDGEVEFVRR